MAASCQQSSYMCMALPVLNDVLIFADSEVHSSDGRCHARSNKGVMHFDMTWQMLSLPG